MSIVWLFLFVVLPSSLFGQSEGTAKDVYKRSEQSVFLIYLNDSGGTPTALGSAFLVAPRTLITNAHVVDAGSPVLAVGPVRIPVHVVRKDSKNDLAVLSVDVDLTSKPLPLSRTKVSPGDEIFAIGNPEGLEKTISQGIVSGVRTIDSRELLQVTSPISHGSSGGPILNSLGEVVAVAVGMFADGQNLNFAVPVSYVTSILATKTTNSTPEINVSEGLSEAVGLLGDRAKLDYSSDSTSEYQSVSRKLISILNSVVDTASRESDLKQAACIGVQAADLSDDGIKAARKLVAKIPTPENRAFLAYTLLDRSENESLAAAFATKDSDEMTKAQKAYQEFMDQAGNEAGEASHHADGRIPLLANYVMANIKQNKQDYAEAIRLHTLVADRTLAVCGNDLTQRAYRSLITETSAANEPEESEKWFRKYASHYTPTPYEWDSEGDRRADKSDTKSAAEAYEKAASGDNDYAYDYCYATAQHFFDPVRNDDAVLDDGKKCVNASVTQSTKSNEHHFKRELPFVYRFMADVLEKRGVYQQALEYIKESISANPEDPYALITEASIFEDLQRNSECIAAAQAAIRLSDGKYQWMHFRLGSCYFVTENWSLAATSFQLSANADKTDAASAFNLGLSLLRQGYSADAQLWFREALKRKPDEALRAKIMRSLN